MQATVLSVQGTYLLQTSKITNNEASVFSSSLLYIHSTYADAGNIQLDNNTQRSWECNAIMLYVTVPWNSKEARRSTPSLCCTVPAPIVHFLYLWVTAIRDGSFYCPRDSFPPETFHRVQKSGKAETRQKRTIFCENTPKKYQKRRNKLAEIHRITNRLQKDCKNRLTKCGGV